MKIRRITLPLGELVKLQPAERNLFFLVGHVNNEISSLAKVFGWCLAGSNPPGTPQIEANAANAQAMIYARLLAGKLLEAWGALERSWFASKIGVEITKQLHPEAIMALQELKRYFGAKNLIFAVRNSFAFHYNADVLGEHWERAAQEPFFELVIGINRGNSFDQASELVANTAVFQTVTPGDAHGGMAAFLHEVDIVSGHFRSFCEGVTRAILERLSGVNLDQQGALSDIAPKRKYSDISIPVFCRPEEDIDGLLP